MTTPEKPVILNLGFGNTPVHGWTNIDFSIKSWLYSHPYLLKLLALTPILPKRIIRQIKDYPSTVIHADLTRGIPYPECSVNAIYFSHVIEHIDISEIPKLFSEFMRVLKPNGTLRILTPDLFHLASTYIDTFTVLEKQKQVSCSQSIDLHLASINSVFDQFRDKYPDHYNSPSTFLGIMQRIILGKTSRDGSQHKWLYDKYSLSYSLRSSGFKTVLIQKCGVSYFSELSRADLDSSGRERKPHSLYIDAIK